MYNDINPETGGENISWTIFENRWRYNTNYLRIDDGGAISDPLNWSK